MLKNRGCTRPKAYGGRGSKNCAIREIEEKKIIKMSTGNRTKYLFMIVYFRGVIVFRTVLVRYQSF